MNDLPFAPDPITWLSKETREVRDQIPFASQRVFWVSPRLDEAIRLNQLLGFLVPIEIPIRTVFGVHYGVADIGDCEWLLEEEVA